MYVMWLTFSPYVATACSFEISIYLSSCNIKLLVAPILHFLWIEMLLNGNRISKGLNSRFFFQVAFLFWILTWTSIFQQFAPIWFAVQRRSISGSRGRWGSPPRSYASTPGSRLVEKVLKWSNILAWSQFRKIILYNELLSAQLHSYQEPTRGIDSSFAFTNGSSTSSALSRWLSRSRQLLSSQAWRLRSPLLTPEVRGLSFVSV